MWNGAFSVEHNISHLILFSRICEMLLTHFVHVSFVTFQETCTPTENGWGSDNWRKIQSNYHLLSTFKPHDFLRDLGNLWKTMYPTIMVPVDVHCTWMSASVCQTNFFASLSHSHFFQLNISSYKFPSWRTFLISKQWNVHSVQSCIGTDIIQCVTSLVITCNAAYVYNFSNYYYTQRRTTFLLSWDLRNDSWFRCCLLVFLLVLRRAHCSWDSWNPRGLFVSIQRVFLW